MAPREPKSALNEFDSDDENAVGRPAPPGADAEEVLSVNGGGCRCSTPGDERADDHAPLQLLFAGVGVAVVRRRRRKR